MRIPLTDEIMTLAAEYDKGRQRGKHFDAEIDFPGILHIGSVGEAIYKILNPDAIYVNKPGYDFYHNGKGIEVKAHKRAYDPVDSDFIQIPLVDIERVPKEVDYVFFAINANGREGYLVGRMNAGHFKKTFKTRLKGETRTDANFDTFTYKTDCAEISVGDIEKP